MVEKFWYKINERLNDKSCQVYLLVSPGYYGRGLSLVHKNIDLIKAQVEKGKLTYDSQKAEADSEMILLEENAEPQIEIGNTNFDKSVMRTLMNAKTSASKEVLEERLKQADFYEGLPTRF